MGLGATLVLLAIAFALQHLLAPKDNKTQQGDGFQLVAPTTEEGIPVAMVYGRVRQKAPNVFWIADVTNVPETETIDTGFFGGSTSITIAHINQFMAAFGLSLGTGVENIKVHAVYANDVPVTGDGQSAPIITSGSFPLTTDGQLVSFIHYTTLGGPGQGGGVGAEMEFHPGTFVQDTDSRMDGPFNISNPSQFYYDSLPAHRGIAYVRARFGRIGENGALPAISFDMEVLPGLLGLDGVTVDQVGGTVEEANPAEVLWEILTSEWRGLGIPSSEVDSTSFIAAGTTLDDEGHGLSMIVAQEVDAVDLLKTVLRQIDGILYFDHASGEIKLKLIRDDYTVGSLPLIDATNVDGDSKPVWKTTIPDEVYNQVRVLFEDRDKNYEERPAVATNDAEMLSQNGRVRTSDQRFPGVKNSTLANKIAFRELKFLSIPTIQLTVKVNREAVDLQPGDAFRFSWPDFSVVDVVFRVQSIDRGTLDDGRVTIHAIRDKFDTGGVQIFTPPGRNPDGPIKAPDFGVVQPVDPGASRGFEVPRFVLANATTWGHVSTNNQYDSYAMILAGRPDSPSGQRMSSYHAETSITGQAAYQRETPITRQVSPIPFARTGQELSRLDYAQTDSVIIEGVVDTSVLNNLTPGSEDDEIAEGQNLIMFTDPTGRSGHTSSFAQFYQSLGYGVDEICAYESFNDLGNGRVELVNVRRGLLDTVPNDLRLGSQVWFLTSSGLSALGRSRYSGDEDLDYRIVPSSGIVSGNPETQDVVLLPLSHRALGWYPAARFYVDVRTVTSGDWNDLGTVHQVVGLQENDPPAITCSRFLVEWVRRDRDNDDVIDNTEADEVLTSGDCEFFAEHRIGYLVLSPHEGAGSWVSGGGLAATVTNDRLENFVSWGPTYLRLRAVRDTANDGRPEVGDVQPLQCTYMLVNLRSFRQLLLNPSFDLGSANWTTESGTPSYSGNGMGEYLGGNEFTTTTTTFAIIHQDTESLATLDVVGQDALLVYYIRHDGTASNQVTATIKDDGGSSLASQAEIPSQATWYRRELKASDIPHGTDALEIELRVNFGAETDPSMMDHFELRIGKFSAELLDDGDMEALTGWSEESGTWRELGSLLGTNALAGAQSVFAPASAASGTLTQEQAMPAGFGPGDWAWLSWWQVNCNSDDDTGEVTLQFLDDGGSVVGTSSYGAQTMDTQDDWEFRTLYAQIPSNTESLKIVIEATRDGGSGDINVGFDEFSLKCIRRRVRHPLSGQILGLMAGMGITEESRDLFESYWRWHHDDSDPIQDTESANQDLSVQVSSSGEQYVAVIDARCYQLAAGSDERFNASSSAILDPPDGESIGVYFHGVGRSGSATGHILGKWDGSKGFKAEMSSGTLTCTVGDGTNTDTISFPDIPVDSELQFWFCVDRAAGVLRLITNYGSAIEVPLTATGDPGNSHVFTVGGTAASATDCWGCYVASAGVGFGDDVEAFVSSHFDVLRSNMFIERLPEDMPPAQAPPEPVRISPDLLHYLGSGGSSPLE